MNPPHLEPTSGVVLPLPQIEPSKTGSYHTAQSGRMEDKNVGFEQPVQPVPADAYVRTNHPAEHIHLAKLRKQQQKYQPLPPPASFPSQGTKERDMTQTTVLANPIEYPGSPYQDYQVALHAQLTPDYFQGGVQKKRDLPSANPRSTDPRNTPATTTTTSPRIQTILDSLLGKACCSVVAFVILLSLIGGFSSILGLITG